MFKARFTSIYLRVTIFFIGNKIKTKTKNTPQTMATSENVKTKNELIITSTTTISITTFLHGYILMFT